MKAIAMFRKVQHSGTGHGREHELFSLSRLRQAVRHLRQRRREAAGGSDVDPILGRRADPDFDPRHGDAGQTARNFEDASSAEFFQAIGERLVRNLAETSRRQPPLPSLPVL